jgi:hypothetical protein
LPVEHFVQVLEPEHSTHDKSIALQPVQEYPFVYVPVGHESRQLDPEAYLFPKQLVHVLALEHNLHTSFKVEQAIHCEVSG